MLLSKKLERSNLSIGSYKNAKFGHKQFKKGQILTNEKRPNKGQMIFKKLVKITRYEVRIS
jgi:hypothetical protein